MTWSNFHPFETAADSTEKTEAQQPWYDRALNGFLDEAKHDVVRLDQTAVKVGTGLAVGATVQFALNNAARMGGEIGAVARAAEVATVAAPLIFGGNEIIQSQDPARELGKMAFETGLFYGTAKLGTMAENVPLAGKLIEAKPMTEVPEGLKFKVTGDKVLYSGNSDVTPFQVRLSSGKGFYVDYGFSGESSLTDMPLELPGVGRFEYTAKSTTLINDSGKFTRDVRFGATSTDKGLDTITSNDGKTFAVSRNGSNITFSPDGRVTALEGSTTSGRYWTFQPDNSFTMKSLPAGKFQLDVAADGQGTFSYAHGTSRGIMGIGGSRLNATPVKREVSAVSVTPDVSEIKTSHGLLLKPDITPIDGTHLDALRKAISSLNLVS